jgi:DNA repair protein RecN (Recombination protein N)
MLVALKIENFALIDRLDLSLKPGLNVLTGETGAGKSIILDAIDMVLGGKSSGRSVRSGTTKALIEATFTTPPELNEWLTTYKIPIKEYLVCSRELTASKGNVRSRFRLNGSLVNRPQLEELRPSLVEITAQGQTVLLGTSDLQRDWLDGFGGQPLLTQAQSVAAAYQIANQARVALERRRRADEQRQEQLDLYEYQSRELSKADLSDPQELDFLKQEQQRLSHSVDLQKQSYQAYRILYESDGSFDSCTDLLGKVETLLSDMMNYDPEVESMLDLVSDALAQVEDASRQINTYGENLETDPERLAEVEQRLSQLKQLCRKYNRDLPELIEYYQEIQLALDSFHGEGQSIEDLEATYEVAQTQLEKDCLALTKLRQKSARELENLLISELKPLAMERVKFKVDLQPQTPTVSGADAVSFLFSPNPGEPLQPLGEIASGGEMSRFLLALKACFSKVDPIGTMIFDEIDVGVSGRVAQAIAQKLYQLSHQHQVLCVTHQPLVAAMADVHFKVNKQVVFNGTQPTTKRQKKASVETLAPQETSVQEAPVDEGDKPDERTIVQVTLLDTPARREEIAQLAGGHSRQESLDFAESLLVQAETMRKTIKKE